MACYGFSPFCRQCFVVIGVSINLSQYGMVFGFTGLLLPQLQDPASSVTIDQGGASWIAALPSLGLLVGNMIIPTIMGNLGRKRANVISITIMTVCWSCIIIANNFTTILIVRFFQGVSLGMVNSLSPIVIGECTSPKNRGAFLTTLSLVLSIGTLLVHTAASFLSWRETATICTAITAFDLVLVLFAPESPSWLAVKGRYNEARNVFRWLRGNNEDEEIERIIEASVVTLRETNAKSNSFVLNIKRTIIDFHRTMKEESFYKPILIAVHVYTLGTFSGVNILTSYVILITKEIAGSEINMPIAVITLAVQRLITNAVAVVLMKKVKRRTTLILTTIMNIASLFAVAGYDLAKTCNLFENSLLGFLLLHILMFSISLGALPLTFIIIGELFSLKYRSISAGLSSTSLSVLFFVTLKTFPCLFDNIGLYGTFFLYGCVLVYCLIVLWAFLPETKDKTLQEIEEGFKSKPQNVELKVLRPLMDSK